MWQFVGFYGYFFSSHSNICTDGPVRQRVALRYSLELLLCLKKKKSNPNYKSRHICVQIYRYSLRFYGTEYNNSLAAVGK